MMMDALALALLSIQFSCSFEADHKTIEQALAFCREDQVHGRIMKPQRATSSRGNLHLCGYTLSAFHGCPIMITCSMRGVRAVHAQQLLNLRQIRLLLGAVRALVWSGQVRSPQPPAPAVCTSPQSPPLSSLLSPHSSSSQSIIEPSLQSLTTDQRT